ncbi:MAG TPA: Uma2 family endonuclease [Isosphaeraceae bacterium]|jgi:Uma2 family endonuclease|nr:Uma2 family endonuclease [Isosphaeraceae bacterium]
MATHVQEQEAQTSPPSTDLDLPAPTVLRGVPWSTYVRLRDEPRNYGLRMTYYDGTLEIMSPEYIHEASSERLGSLVRAAAKHSNLAYIAAGSTTFRLPGQRKRKGHGKEPDRCFYIASVPRIRGKKNLDFPADPPPDLWIEVDNRGSSRGRLPVYARLGVPEVWRYDARKNTLWFGRRAGETYEAIEHSLCLPILTPARTLEALALGEGLADSEWEDRLVAWLGKLPAGGPRGERGA